MEILKRKGFVQKIIITLIVLIMFNFIVPNYSMAWGNDGGSLASPITSFVCWVGDKIIEYLQKIFLESEINVSEKKRAIDVLREQDEKEMKEITEKWATSDPDETNKLSQRYIELEKRLEEYDIIATYYATTNYGDAESRKNGCG